MSEKRGPTAGVIAGGEMHSHVLIGVRSRTSVPDVTVAGAEEGGCVAAAYLKRGPYGGESPDYEAYRYGYPPFSGRMFGSGN
jgi:hypothetical protein